MLDILQMIALLAAGHFGVNAGCSEKRDVALLVDGSSTICGAQTCPNWDYIIQLNRDIVGKLDIGSDNTRVAFVLVSDIADVKWKLNTYTDDTALLSALDATEYPGGELSTTGALRNAVVEIFSQDAGDRPDVQNVAILITDGAPNINAENATAAAAAIHQAGIKVFVVGVQPGCSETFARGLSSPPKEAGKNYFLVSGFSFLKDVVKKLVEEICAS